MDVLEALRAKRPQLALRARVLQAARAFFIAEGFLEVQTPIRTPTPAPELHIEAMGADDGWFLITSPELHMKQLLAAGYERLFQLTPVFRQGELGWRHHPEFTMLEWYRARADYEALQADCRRLIDSCAAAAGRSGGWTYRGARLDPAAPWQLLTVREAFERWAGWSPGAAVDQDRFDIDMVEKVEPHLGFPAPCILKDYPADQAALARLKAEDPTVAERFELYWAGVELANGFSELTDPDEQRRRFEAVLTERDRQGLPPYPLPERFLDCLESMPPSAGIALGIDRLVMLLADAASLDEVVAFPPALA